MPVDFKSIILGHTNIAGYKTAPKKWSPSGKIDIIYNSKKYKRYRAGLESNERMIYKDKGLNIKDEYVCDCDAPYGEYHKLGCDLETCPICKKQLLSCGHRKLFIDDKEISKKNKRTHNVETIKSVFVGR